MGVYAFYNLIEYISGTFCPDPLLAGFAGVSSLIAIGFAPTVRLRILGGGGVFVVSLLLAVVYIDWLDINQVWHKRAEFTSSILRLGHKLKEYFNENPEVTFTNVSDYVRLGVVNSRDTAFLSNCSAVVIPPKLGGPELLVVEDVKKRVSISRNEELPTWEFK